MRQCAAEVRRRAETAGRDRAVLGRERGEDGGVAAERAEEVRAANGRAAGVRRAGANPSPIGSKKRIKNE